MGYDTTRIYSARPNADDDDVTSSGTDVAWTAREGHIDDTFADGDTKTVCNINFTNHARRRVLL